MTDSVSLPTATSRPITKASSERRFVAYVIDVLIGAGCAAAFGARGKPSPAMWVGVAFLLTRDLVGPSPGKRLLGMRVVRRDDNTCPAGLLPRLGRNVVFAAAAARAALIPAPGLSAIWLLPLVAGAAALFDGGYLWDRGERLSDRIMGTAVVEV
jgi:hypothetical protein